jgi:cation diffusion facilitator CzcD-associated flavoprotein CzcO
MLDVVIVGGGPAGLNAALLLGRARRRVLVCDAGAPRNAPVSHTHGFLSRDGLPPAELRRIAREQLGAYSSVELREVQVEAASTADGEGFVVTLADGVRETARRLLLATGVVDQLPAIDGLADLWGRGIFNCPYCDGWEVRDQPLAVLGADPRALQLALHLTRWSGDVVVQQRPAARVAGRCGPRPDGGPGGPTAAGPDRAHGGRRWAAGPDHVRDQQTAGATGGVPAPADPAAQRPAQPARLRAAGGRLGQRGRLRPDQRARRVRRRRHGPAADHAGPGAQVVVAAAEGAIAAIAIDQDLLMNDLAG